MNRIVEKTIVGLFAAGGVTIIVMLLHENEFIAASLWALVVFAPAAAFLLGIRWCRWIVCGCAVLLLIFWTLTPAMQHEVDRHLAFWSMWFAIEGLLAATVWTMIISPNRPSQEGTLRRQNAVSRDQFVQ
jgi:cell division protein FtsW (lipid II flippase)